MCLCCVLFCFCSDVYCADFGLCLDLSAAGWTDEAVKYGIHAAPEKVYSETADVYSLGAVLYELLSLVDLSHDALYAMNTTLLAQERVRVAGSLEKLPLSAQFAVSGRVVADMLLANPASRPSARLVFRKLTALLGRIPAAGIRSPLVLC